MNPEDEVQKEEGMGEDAAEVSEGEEMEEEETTPEEGAM